MKTPQTDINSQDGNDNRNTTLHLAIERNELEVVRFLLSQEADTIIENGDGKTPLQLAAKCNNVDFIKVLKGCTSLLATDRLASHTSQPAAANPIEVSVSHSNSHLAVTGKEAASTVLPPFSGKLREDKELNWSNDDFKKTIEKFHEE